jgi:hypothetical protein
VKQPNVKRFPIIFLTLSAVMVAFVAWQQLIPGLVERKEANAILRIGFVALCEVSYLTTLIGLIFSLRGLAMMGAAGALLTALWILATEVFFANHVSGWELGAQGFAVAAALIVLMERKKRPDSVPGPFQRRHRKPDLPYLELDSRQTAVEEDQSSMIEQSAINSQFHQTSIRRHIPIQRRPRYLSRGRDPVQSVSISRDISGLDDALPPGRGINEESFSADSVSTTRPPITQFSEVLEDDPFATPLD